MVAFLRFIKAKYLEKGGKKMNLQKFKEKRGITLIALVVTIIVLVILAGVTLGALTGENRNLDQSK